MHPNFYHWHIQAEFKPEVSVLAPRWSAAENFAEMVTAADILPLVRLVLFPGTEPEFAKRFTDVLKQVEPTFPLNKNAELIRVMASAAVYSRLEKSTPIANALALGLKAASFPKGRTKPICPDVMTRSVEYLAEQSERMRPNIDAGALEKSEKQTQVHFAALTKAVESTVPQEIGKATEALNRGVLGAMKESHKRLGEVINRLTEESQFLWWLISRQSPSLQMRRERLSREAYALPAAEEAAKRVTLLPPASSVESLLDEAISQCKSGGRANVSLTELIEGTDGNWLEDAQRMAPAAELTPLVALLAERQQGKSLSQTVLKRLRIPDSTKVTPLEVSRQYFRELMFLRAIKEVG